MDIIFISLGPGPESKNIFGVNEGAPFCKLDHFIAFLCWPKMVLLKKGVSNFAFIKLPTKKFYNIEPRGLYYKTFYSHNLRIFIIS